MPTIGELVKSNLKQIEKKLVSTNAKEFFDSQSRKNDFLLNQKNKKQKRKTK